MDQDSITWTGTSAPGVERRWLLAWRSGDKKQTNPASKNEAPPENKSTSGADSSKAEEGGEIADALPSGYSRGEGQKPVSKAYKDNWDAIFAKKKKR
jgi:hypothetical protein